MPVGAIIGIIAAAVVLLIILANLKIVPQAAEYVIEFLGKYKATWTAGVHIKVPFFERIAKRVTLKEQVLDSPPQPVITKDNVTMQIDTVIYFCIFFSVLPSSEKTAAFYFPFLSFSASIRLISSRSLAASSNCKSSAAFFLASLFFTPESSRGKQMLSRQVRCISRLKP